MREIEGLGMLKKLLRKYGDTSSMVLLLQEVKYIHTAHKHISAAPCDQSNWRDESGRTQTSRKGDPHIEDDCHRGGGIIPYKM